jgi:hypothetical protein
MDPDGNRCKIAPMHDSFPYAKDREEEKERNKDSGSDYHSSLTNISIQVLKLARDALAHYAKLITFGNDVPLPRGIKSLFDLSGVFAETPLAIGYISLLFKVIGYIIE